MKITNSVRSLVAKGMRDKEVSRATLAKKLNLPRSWPTKFFNGTLKNLSDDHIMSIQDILDLSFAQVEVRKTSELTVSLAKQIEKSPELAKVMEELLSVIDDDHYYDLPLLPTDALVDFGKEILRASHEDPEKPGKVGKIAITWLAERLKSLKP